MTRAGGWIVSPAFDLLFLANLGWLLLLLPGFASRAGTAADFWTLYYLTLPHRWVTLVLVAADADRREGRTRKLAVIAAAAAVVVAVAAVSTETLLCLAVVDFVWNAWHFGSQHAGVLRMYTRKVGGGSAWLERWGVRLFVTYAAIRAAGWTTGWLEGDAEALAWLRAADLGMLAVPAALLLTNAAGLTRDRVGKFAYLLSLCSLYAGFLTALSLGRVEWVVVFAAAGSLFHAVEYLAVVTHYARRRETVGGDGPFRIVARYWLLFLGAYVLVLGSAGVWLADPAHGVAPAWAAVNLWAAFVHYAYDGMIWKLRRPETAAALGVANP